MSENIKDALKKFQGVTNVVIRDNKLEVYYSGSANKDFVQVAVSDYLSKRMLLEAFDEVQFIETTGE